MNERFPVTDVKVDVISSKALLEALKRKNEKMVPCIEIERCSLSETAHPPENKEV